MHVLCHLEAIYVSDGELNAEKAAAMVLEDLMEMKLSHSVIAVSIDSPDWTREEVEIIFRAMIHPDDLPVLDDDDGTFIVEVIKP